MSKAKRLRQKRSREKFIASYLCRQGIRDCWVRRAGGECGHDA